MGNKSKKPPVRNSSVKVFTRDTPANFDSQTSESSSSASSASASRRKCWTFELAELTVSLDALQINDPVSADVMPDEVTVYSDTGTRLGKAPTVTAKQISKAAESEDKFKLYGKIIGKTSANVEITVCFE